MRERKPRVTQSCDWHIHSMFYPCENGLYIRDYLHADTPRTARQAIVGRANPTHANP